MLKVKARSLHALVRLIQLSVGNLNKGTCQFLNNSLRAKQRNSLSVSAKALKACYLQYYLKVTETCSSSRCQTRESPVSALEVRKKQTNKQTKFLNIHRSKGFRESNLLFRICRNSYRPSVLSCACTSMSYTLTSKSFTLSQKKATIDRLLI